MEAYFLSARLQRAPRVPMSELAAYLGRLTRSPAFKFFLIAFLVILLLVPMLLVASLVGERDGRAREVRADIARVWGGSQQLFGPLLIVPYTVRVVANDGERRIEQLAERRAVFTPEQLSITAEAATQVLHRGIYQAPVYTTKLRIAGRFPSPEIGDVVSDPQSVRWRDAILALGIGDVSGLKEAAVLKLDGQTEVPFLPSLGVPGVQASGIHAKLPAFAAAGQPGGAPTPAFTFQLDLVLAGSLALEFAPAARETRLAMTSDWPDPSFSGAFLPIERSLSATGFTARWTVPHLARSVPQAWTLADPGLDRFRPFYFGVQLFQPVGFYDLVMRAVKYDVLFVGLAFMGVFVLELSSPRRVHAVQYLFVGMALTFFYVLLLSLAEHIGFAVAYMVAATLTGGMLALYVARSLESRTQGLLMAAVFAVLYGLLYLILRLEDYALLAGAAVGFLTLTIVMFATLHVDWSGAERREA
jgi:inner membrane protein